MKIQRVRPGWDYEIDVEDDAVVVVASADEHRAFALAASQNETLTEDELARAEDMARQILAELEES